MTSTAGLTSYGIELTVQRNVELNQAALSLAQKLGPIDVNEEGQKCDPLDVVKHLTSDDLKAKLGLE